MKMKMRNLPACLGGLMLVVLPFCVDAANAVHETTAQDFLAQRKQIEAEFADGEKYSEITGAQRQDVRDALAIIAGKLDGKASTADLDEVDRVEVFNQQERVNTILTSAAEDSRLVCTREQSVGSHRTTTKCMTVAERRRSKDEADKELRKNFKAGIQTSGN